MPRQAIASTPANRSVQSSARGAPKAVASPPGLKSVLADTRAQLDTKQTCPLCIEELDDTDRDFFPCPCGYQICLFCYGQVKEKCNSQCPGCRRQYGEPVDGPLLRQQIDDTARLTAATPRSGASALQTKPGGTQLTKPKGTHDMMGARGRSGDDTTPLPSGATWASHSARQQAGTHATPAPASAPPPVDQSAWPSLSDSTATSARRRDTRHEPQHLVNLTQSLADAASDSESSRRSSSPSSADLTPLDSHSSSSQDLSHDQAAMLDVCAAAAVLSTPLASTRTPAAARPLPAGKAPPPGFANVTPRTQPISAPTPAAPAVSACLTHQDPSIAGPPLGRCQPIQPPFHQHSMQQQQQQQQHGGYSLWSGLPGFEINLAQLFGGVHVLSAYTCNVPGAYPMAGCHGAKITPPPGFGPVPYAGSADYGAQRVYQVFGAGGSQFMGMARPSGMAV